MIRNSALLKRVGVDVSLAISFLKIDIRIPRGLLLVAVMVILSVGTRGGWVLRPDIHKKTAVSKNPRQRNLR